MPNGDRNSRGEDDNIFARGRPCAVSYFAMTITVLITLQYIEVTLSGLASAARNGHVSN